MLKDLTWQICYSVFVAQIRQG